MKLITLNQNKYYIFVKKKEGICDGVYIYTNNQCIPQSWTRYIITCLEHRAEVVGLINNIVLAFKINDQIIEPGRSSSSKQYNEFVKCVMIPNNSSLCFIDNVVFNQMINKNVYYIQPPPYFHNLSIMEIIVRFINSGIGNLFMTKCGLSYDDLREKMYKFSQMFGRYDKLATDNTVRIEKCYNIDISKKIMYYIREYLFYSQKKKRKTIKKRGLIINKTRKCKSTNYTFQQN